MRAKRSPQRVMFLLANHHTCWRMKMGEEKTHKQMIRMHLLLPTIFIFVSCSYLWYINRTTQKTKEIEINGNLCLWSKHTLDYRFVCAVVGLPSKLGDRDNKWERLLKIVYKEGRYCSGCYRYTAGEALNSSIFRLVKGINSPNKTFNC